MELELQNNKENNNLEIGEKFKNFMNSSLGKTINTGIDIGLKIVLPDLIEDELIEVKNTLLENGLKEGINKAIEKVVDFGKSALGIVTGNFENISQVQLAVKNGGIIDSVSYSIDSVLEIANNKNIINNEITNLIKKGKNVILENISNQIEENLNNQVEGIEYLDKYINNWNNYYQNKDFKGMEKEYKKINEKLKELIPLENTLKKARILENIHNLIKNNGNNFNLKEEEINLAQKL